MGELGARCLLRAVDALARFAPECFERLFQLLRGRTRLRLGLLRRAAARGRAGRVHGFRGFFERLAGRIGVRAFTLGVLGQRLESARDALGQLGLFGLAAGQDRSERALGCESLRERAAGLLGGLGGLARRAVRGLSGFGRLGQGRASLRGRLACAGR